MARKNKAEDVKYNKDYYEKRKQDKEWYAKHLARGNAYYQASVSGERLAKALRIVKLVREHGTMDEQELAQLVSDEWVLRERSK